MSSFVSVRRACVLALVAAAACEDGSGTTAPPQPASVVAVSATTQSGTVASPVPVPPSVQVRDARGYALPGVQVDWAVTSGNGTVTSSSVTDGGGIAVAAAWVTGPASVENVLTATVSGVAPVAFRVAAQPGPAARLEKAGGDAQTAAVGTRLADSISVRVVDAFGNGVPDVPVNFATNAGTLSAARAITGAQGHARVSLVLPTRPGTLQVTASTGIMTPLVFAATVTVGPPAALTRLQGDGQAADSGTAVTVAPAVRVTDSFGNPVPGRPVTFTPAAGSGAVTGGTASTSSDGRAAVGSWVLGLPGVNRLVARVAGVADSVVFTATSREPCRSGSYTLFSTLVAQLDSNRCNVGGRNAELYRFTVATEQCVEFRMNSGFDAFLYLLDGNRNIVAADDDSGGSLNSLIRYRVSPGTYHLGAAAYSGGTGPFEITSSPLPNGESCGFSLSSGRQESKRGR